MEYLEKEDIYIPKESKNIEREREREREREQNLLSKLKLVVFLYIFLFILTLFGLFSWSWICNFYWRKNFWGYSFWQDRINNSEYYKFYSEDFVSFLEILKIICSVFKWIMGFHAVLMLILALTKYIFFNKKKKDDE